MSLKSLYINPTRYCNLRCRHCWVSPPIEKEQNRSDELSIKEIIAIVEEAKKIGLESIKLTGGEPLLRKDLEGLLEFCFNSGIEITIETNGTLVTKAMAGLFRKYKVGHISVSLDSASEKMNDFLRGCKGAFNLTVDGIKHLCDEGLSPQVIMSLYHENMTEFEFFVDFMEELTIDDIKINTISPVGRGAELCNKGLVPGIKEILDFSAKVESIDEFYDGSVVLDIPIAFKSLDTVKHKGCAVCTIKHILGILSDGSVSICGIGYVDEGLIFGNLRKDPSIVKDIWRNDPILREIREGMTAKLEGVCGICVFKNKCIGNCRAEVYHNTGTLTAAHWFCQEAYSEGLFPVTRLIPEALRK